jgi:hypothetical protein
MAQRMLNGIRVPESLFRTAQQLPNPIAQQAANMQPFDPIQEGYQLNPQTVQQTQQALSMQSVPQTQFINPIAEQASNMQPFDPRQMGYQLSPQTLQQTQQALTNQFGVPQAPVVKPPVGQPNQFDINTPAREVALELGEISPYSRLYVNNKIPTNEFEQPDKLPTQAPSSWQLSKLPMNPQTGQLELPLEDKEKSNFSATPLGKEFSGEDTTDADNLALSNFLATLGSAVAAPGSWEDRLAQGVLQYNALIDQQVKAEREEKRKDKKLELDYEDHQLRLESEEFNRVFKTVGMIKDEEYKYDHLKFMKDNAGLRLGFDYYKFNKEMDFKERMLIEQRRDKAIQDLTDKTKKDSELRQLADYAPSFAGDLLQQIRPKEFEDYGKMMQQLGKDASPFQATMKFVTGLDKKKATPEQLAAYDKFFEFSAYYSDFIKLDGVDQNTAGSMARVAAGLDYLPVEKQVSGNYENDQQVLASIKERAAKGNKKVSPAMLEYAKKQIAGMPIKDEKEREEQAYNYIQNLIKQGGSTNGQ